MIVSVSPAETVTEFADNLVQSSERQLEQKRLMLHYETLSFAS